MSSLSRDANRTLEQRVYPNHPDETSLSAAANRMNIKGRMPEKDSTGTVDKFTSQEHAHLFKFQRYIL